MSVAKTVSEFQNRNFKRIDDILEKIKKFEKIKPEETIWSEKRLLDTVRTQFISTKE